MLPDFTYTKKIITSFAVKVEAPRWRVVVPFTAIAAELDNTK